MLLRATLADPAYEALTVLRLRLLTLSFLAFFALTFNVARPPLIVAVPRDFPFSVNVTRPVAVGADLTVACSVNALPRRGVVGLTLTVVRDDDTVGAGGAGGGGGALTVTETCVSAGACLAVPG